MDAIDAEDVTDAEDVIPLLRGAAPPVRRLTYQGDDTGPIAIRGDFGERLVDVAALAWDQDPFAVRLRPWQTSPAPGVTFSARSIDLGADRFTNSFELVVDAGRAMVAVCSGTDGFFLPDLVGPGAGVAAVSGSFSFISDEPDYQPAEPCLDFCCRDGVVVSLPTVAKPALLIVRGRPLLRDLDARGTLSIGGRAFGWIGSKVPAADGDADRLVVYGAANCRVRYSLAPRTGFLREVERESNISPRRSGIVDVVVGRRGAGHDHTVLALRDGGGVDLFEGSYILRGPSALADEIRPGDRVRVGSIADLDCAELESGTSVGPSLAAAQRGETDGHDESLGVSPFQPGRRHARTVISVEGGLLRLRVLDAAPLTRSFTGVSSAEAAELMAADGVDPSAVYHLDGGQSSKTAVWENGAAEVFGSMHYMLWPKTVEGPFLWRGNQGRRLRSAIRIGSA